jgi:hypothetical protein
VTFKMSTKMFFCWFFYFLKVHLHNFSKKKSHTEFKKGTKQWINVFLTIFAWWQKDLDPYFWLMDSDREAKKNGSYDSGSGSATLVNTNISLFVQTWNLKW